MQSKGLSRVFSNTIVLVVTNKFPVAQGDGGSKSDMNRLKKKRDVIYVNTLQMVTAAMRLKDAYSLEGKL